VTGTRADEPENHESTDRALLHDRLLYLAAELESIMAFAYERSEPDPEGPAKWLYYVGSPLPGESSREALRRWALVFADELRTVQLARNSVVHAKILSDDSLRNAIEIADRLVEIARSSVTGELAVERRRTAS